MSKIISTKSIEFPRFWFLTVDSDVVDDVDTAAATKMVESVLLDSRGWKKYGYTFVHIPVETGIIMRKKKSNWSYVFHLRISSKESLLKECQFDKLSCAIMTENVILFNIDRWKNGSRESGLFLEDYRRYVVLHEVGHLLGREHNSCSMNTEEMCPVMYQQTISKGCCKPNPWPLEWE